MYTHVGFPLQLFGIGRKHKKRKEKNRNGLPHANFPITDGHPYTHISCLMHAQQIDASWAR